MTSLFSTCKLFLADSGQRKTDIGLWEGVGSVSTRCAMGMYHAYSEIKAKSRSKPGLITKFHIEGTPSLPVPHLPECLVEKVLVIAQ